MQGHGHNAHADAHGLDVVLPQDFTQVDRTSGKRLGTTQERTDDAMLALL